MVALALYPLGNGSALGTTESAVSASVDVTLVTKALTISTNSFIIGFDDGQVDIVTKALTITTNPFEISLTIGIDAVDRSKAVTLNNALEISWAIQLNKGVA